MKLIINHKIKQEAHDLGKIGCLILNVKDANWLKIYKIGDEMRICFEFDPSEDDGPIPNKWVEHDQAR